MKKAVVALGRLAAGLVPALDVLELDGEDGALEAVHAGVPADLIMVVAALHAVLAESADPLGQLAGIGGDHAGVAGGAQVLGGIKAEGGDVAEAPGFHSVPLGAVGLGGVFDELELALTSDTGKRGPVGWLAVEVDGEDGF